MKNVKAAMSLKRFMMRQEVLKLYKQSLGLGKHLQAKDEESLKQVQDEWKSWVQTEFRLRKDVQDEDVIKNLIVIGRRQVGELERTIRIANG